MLAPENAALEEQPLADACAPPCDVLLEVHNAAEAGAAGEQAQQLSSRDSWGTKLLQVAQSPWKKLVQCGNYNSMLVPDVDSLLMDTLLSWRHGEQQMGEGRRTTCVSPKASIQSDHVDTTLIGERGHSANQRELPHTTLDSSVYSCVALPTRLGASLT